ncbi:MAG: S1-C subfamily serine protease [bacterium]|jgi:S1-C subfamily serine protease
MIRLLFFTICIVTGIAAGWWWSQGLPHLSSLLAKSGDKSGIDGNNDAAVLNSQNKSSSNPGAFSDNGETAQITERHSPAALSFYDGIMKVAPAVVSLYARNSASNQSNSQGSGVIVDANGIILTNFHLIENLDLITVVLSDGRSYAAKLIGSDQETDLAVVKIETQNLPFLRLDEAAPLRVGDIVLAIGNPFGVGQTVTQGIVSATRRKVAGGSVWQNFVQIDAAINPGNSGGALINPYGQLVGVNTAVFRGDSGAVGIGFSIPADLLAQVVPQIIENGSVARGWLGIGVEDIAMFPALRKFNINGAVITEALENSPANAGGLQPMDIVVRLGEETIANATQLLLKVSALPPGATVKLSILRSTKADSLTDSMEVAGFDAIDLKVRLGLRPTLTVVR